MKTKSATKAKKSTARRPSTGRAAAKRKSDNGAASRHGGIGSDAVLKATGKTWAEWIRILDAAGARDWDHKTIAEYAHDELGIRPWWSQMVTVGYEQAVGKRVPHQKVGGFSVSGSKTLAVPVAALYNAWTDARLRRRWLPDATLNITTSRLNKSIRGAWGDGRTRFDVNLYAKGAGKSQITVQHDKLKDATEAAKMKTYWKKRLEVLQTVLEE